MSDKKLIIDYVDANNFNFKLGEINTSNKVLFANREDYKPILGNIKLYLQDDAIDIEVNSIEIENDWIVINDWLKIKNDNYMSLTNGKGKVD